MGNCPSSNSGQWNVDTEGTIEHRSSNIQITKIISNADQNENLDQPTQSNSNGTITTLITDISTKSGSNVEDAEESNKETKTTDKKIADSENPTRPVNGAVGTKVNEDASAPDEEKRKGVIFQPPATDLKLDEKLPVYPKTIEDEQLIKAAIEKNEFVNKIITGKNLDSVVAAMYNKEISPRSTIIKQGEDGNHMYISVTGRYQFIVNGKVQQEFQDVRVFGELAILYKNKRLATVKTLTGGRLWVLDRNIYQKIVRVDHLQRETETMEFLMKNETLNVVGKDALQVVASLLKTEFFSTEKTIVKQGDRGTKFYIIRAGTVTITKDGVVIGIYKKGDCFGELALLKEDCRQATVIANSPGVECLTLTRKEFIDHFGEIGDRFQYISTQRQSTSSITNTNSNSRGEFEDIALNDLKIIATLGVGGFGRVELVQHNTNTNLVFALKYMKKFNIVEQQQQEHAINERNIQMRCRSAFIVRLYRTYKCRKYVYYLMEPCLGGDLWSLLQKQRSRRFDEKDAKFICGCVLEAFEYLHSKGIVYRDLKPENLMISPNGYIKLTDFGFAKILRGRGKTLTFAGTPEYVAPEIVLNKGHDRAVDYWAFGAFIFEMLTGKTPFRTDDTSHMRTYNNILSGIDNVTFPTFVNPRAKQIVEKLCRPIPSERLGMQKGGIKDIKMHKWFQGFDFQKLARCEYPSPFRPRLKSNIDTSNIETFNKDSDVPPDEFSGWDDMF